MNDFNVILSVPEEWTDYDRLCKTCDYYLSKKKETSLITILAQNSNELISRYAGERGYQISVVPVVYSQGKRAMWLRDNRMADLGNACIAFFSSYGLNNPQHSIVNVCMKRRNILVRTISEDQDEE